MSKLSLCRRSSKAPIYYPEATPHGEIEQIFTDVFVVKGSVQMMLGIQVSRNMIILLQGHELTLISAVRLNDRGLQQLDRLGQVRHVVKLGAYHLDAKNG